MKLTAIHPKAKRASVKGFKAATKQGGQDAAVLAVAVVAATVKAGSPCAPAACRPGTPNPTSNKVKTFLAKVKAGLAAGRQARATRAKAAKLAPPAKHARNSARRMPAIPPADPKPAIVVEVGSGQGGAG